MVHNCAEAIYQEFSIEYYFSAQEICVDIDSMI